MSDDNSSFKIILQAMLDRVKSLANIKADIKAIEAKLPKIKIKGTLDKTATNKELKAKIKDIKPKVKVDADTTSAVKKIKKLEKQKTKTVIQTKTDNSQIVSGIKEAQKETKTLWERFTSGITGINLIQIGVQKVVQAIHQAIAGIKELDAIKTNIQMVSGTSDSEVNAMMSSYNTMAKELSSTTKDVASAANEFLRMGESIETTNELIKSSQVLSKIGMVESSEAANYLISSLKGYQIATKDSMDIVSKLTAVDMEAAVSAGGLSEALSKCANIANNSGISMDRLIGYTATVGEITQKSMSEVGNSFQSLLSRMSNIKIGRFIDDETGESLSDTEAVLNKLGIRLRETEDTYRDFDEVLDDVGSRWKDFTKVEQNAISVAIAGTRQRENFEALMNNWANALKYSETAANSAGSALERYGVYQDSIEAKTNELTAAIESLSTSAISKELYSGIIVATTNVVEFIDKANLLKGTLAGLATMSISKTFISIASSIISASRSTAQLTAAMKLFDNGRSKQNLLAIGAACKGLSEKQLKLVLSTKGLTNEQRLQIVTGMGVEKQERQQTLATLGFATAEDKATASTFSLKGAMNALSASFAANPVGFVLTAISALATIIPIATSVVSAYNQKLAETRQKAKELADAYRQQQSSLNAQIDKYKELKESLDSGNLSVDEARSVKEELLEIQNSLVDSFGNEVSNLDLVNGKYKEQLGLLAELSKEKAADFVVENRDVFDNAKEQLEKVKTYDLGTVTSWSNYAPKTKEQQALLDYIEAYSDFLELTYKGGANTSAVSVSVKADVQNADEVMRQFSKDLEEYGEKNGIDVSNILNQIPEQLRNTWTDELEEYKTIYDEFIKAEIIRSDTLRPLYQQSIQAVEDYNNALSTGEGITEAKADLDSLQQSVQNATNELEGSQAIFDGIYEGINKNAEAAYQLNQAFEADSTIQEYAEQLRGLSDIDIKAINLDNENIENGEEAFRGLLETLGYTEPTEEQIQSLIDKLVELEYIIGETKVTPDISSTFDFPTYEEQVDNIQSALSKLRSALDSFNKGELDKIQVLDLMQQFPSLVPYIDLTAEGFGNLSEGLSMLISQQPDSLIQSIQSLKDSLSTDEERQQVELLIDQLQRLSSYGDSGIEAYAATIGNTWDDTANVIEGVTTQFENLAKVQETVANGLTMSATAAAELAKMYPEILTNAEVSANGQITLNEDIVNSILDGDKSIVEAQIAKLEADEAVLIARKDAAVAELEIANQVGTAKGQTDEATARNKIELLNQELENEISKNNQAGQSYAQTAESMAQNMEQLDSYEAEVADNMAKNSNSSSASMANGMAVNSTASQKSLSGLMHKVADVAKAIAGVANGETVSDPDKIYSTEGGTNTGGITKVGSSSKFSSTVSDYLKGEISLSEFKSGLEVDISAYTDAISNIDAQIEVLKNLQLTFDNNGGIGGHGYADQIKQLEKEKEGINNALKDTASSSSSSAKETAETFDWIETAVSRVQHVIKNLGNTVSATWKNWTKRNSSLASEFSEIRKEISLQQSAYENYMKTAESVGLSDHYKNLVKNGALSIESIADDTLKEQLKTYQEWYEKALDCADAVSELNDQLAELAETRFDHITSEYDERVQSIDHAVNLINTELDKAETLNKVAGESFYDALIDMEQARIKNLTSEYNDMLAVFNESVSSGIIEECSEAWHNMKSEIDGIAESINEANVQVLKYEKSLKEVAKLKFDSLESQFSNALSLIASEMSQVEGQISLIEEAGYIAGESFYTSLADAEKANVESLIKEYETLSSALQDALDSGSIEKFDDNWYEMAGSINDVRDALMDAETALVSYSNSLKELNWDIFDRMQESISGLADESDFIIDLMSQNNDLYNEDGAFNDRGLAVQGLHAVNYDVYMRQAQEYADAIRDLNKEIAEDPNNTKLLDRYNELVELQRQAILNAEDEKTAIKDLASNGYDKLLSYFKELATARKDALKAASDQRDYEKKISDKASNVEKLQKILEAYKGDDSDETKATIQKTTESLINAQEELSETEYEKYISDQEAMLDNFLDDMELWVNQRLDDVNGLLQQAIDATNENAQAITTQINTDLSAVGMAMTDNFSRIFEIDYSGGVRDIVSGYFGSGGDFATAMDNVNNAIFGIQEKSDSLKVSTDNVSSTLNQRFPELMQSVSTATSGVENAIGNVKEGVENAVGTAKEAVDGIGVKVAELGDNTVSAIGNTTDAIGNVKSAVDLVKSTLDTINTTIAGLDFGSQSSGNTSSSPSNSQSSGSSSTSSSGSSSDSWVNFIDKNDSYDKSKLNTNTSIVDELKKNNYDSSFEARKKYYYEMGGTGTYTGSAEQNTWMLNQMKIHGYAKGVHKLKKDEIAWTQEKGPEMILSPSRNAVMTDLTKGDTVLTNKQTENMFGWSKIEPSDYIKLLQNAPAPTMPNIPNIPLPEINNIRNNAVNKNEISLTMNLPNVKNYDELITEMQHDNRFERIVQSMTIGNALGKSRYNKFKY